MSAAYGALESFAKALFEECNSDEDAVAVALGYIPARLSAELWDTYGLHIIDQELWGRQRLPSLKVDCWGFEYEMAKKGADVSGMVQELKQIRRFYEPKGKS